MVFIINLTFGEEGNDDGFHTPLLLPPKSIDSLSNKLNDQGAEINTAGDSSVRGSTERKDTGPFRLWLESGGLR